MPREKLKRPKPRGESTEARAWGGPIRTSVEGPVIGPEQRDRVRSRIDVTTGNRMTTTITTNKPFHIDKKRVYDAY
jgi:hypothetical protein